MRRLLEKATKPIGRKKQRDARKKKKMKKCEGYSLKKKLNSDRT